MSTSPALPDASPPPSTPLGNAAGSGETVAQCVNGTFTGDITLQTPSDFTFLKDCTRISGTVTIVTRQLTDLRGFERVREVIGSLRIVSDLAALWSNDLSMTPTHTDLSALRSLELVDTLELAYLSLPSMSLFAGLGSLQTLRVRHVAALQDLKGLERVTPYTVVLQENPDLRELQGLTMSSMPGELDLYANPNFSTLRGLSTSGLTKLAITASPKLANLDGLQGLTSITQLSMLYCDGLVDLTGLNPGVRIQVLDIEQSQLRSLTGLTGNHGLLEVTLALDPQLASLSGLVSADHTLGTLTLDGLAALKSLNDLSTLQKASVLKLRACDGLTDLTGLTQLQSLHSLAIEDCAGLTSLTGAGALETLAELSLISLPRLPSLQGLPKLRTAGALLVSGCSQLTSLSGLENAPPSAVTLADNITLTSLHGLEGAKQLSTLSINNNNALPNLTGLDALERVDLLEIGNDPALTSLTGLSALRTANSVTLNNNAALANLDALGKLTTTNTLTIVGSTVLTSLRGLSGLQPPLPTVQIYQNPRLPQCEVDWFLKRLGQSQAILPGANGPQGTCAP